MGGFLSGLFGTQQNTNTGQQAAATGQALAANNPYTPAQLQQQYQFGQANQAAEQGLAGQLSAQSQGQGPNPALAQLNQTTNANNQQSAGMLASTAGLNPAVAAKLAATNQANSNQGAAGQAATMEAQQQLAAEGQLAGLQGQMGQQAQGQQSVANQANLGTQAIGANIAGANTQAAGQAAGAGLGALGSLGSLAGSLVGGGASAIPTTSVAAGGMIQKMAGGGVSNPYMDIVASNSGLPASITNAGETPNTPNPIAQGSSIGSGLMGGIGSIGSKLLGSGSGSGGDAGAAAGDTAMAGSDVSALGDFASLAAKGGMMYAPGGVTGAVAPQPADPNMATQGVPMKLNAPTATGSAVTPNQAPYTGALTDANGNPETGATLAQGQANQTALQNQATGAYNTQAAAQNTNAQAALAQSQAAQKAQIQQMNGVGGPNQNGQPTAIQSGLMDVAQYGGLMGLLASGGMINMGDKLRQGGSVPGKAVVKGDSYANDKVNARLSPGEVVIPRHIMQGPDPANNAAKFVAACLAKSGKR
jgi:hypothetical protein